MEAYDGESAVKIALESNPDLISGCNASQNGRFYGMQKTAGENFHPDINDYRKGRRSR